MNINYEMVILLMLGLLVACTVMIIKLADTIKDLKDRIEKLHARVNDVYYNTVDINANIGKILSTVNTTKDLISDVWSENEKNYDFPEPGEEDEEWTPEPDDDKCDLCVVHADEEENPIYLITPNDFFFRGPNDKFELDYIIERDEVRYYYCGAEFIVIDNVAECIGEGLKFFGVNSKDPNVAYVRNNIFKADFRIVKRSKDDV